MPEFPATNVDAPEYSALSIDFTEQGAGKSGGLAMRSSSASASAPEIPAGISMPGQLGRSTAENLGDRHPCTGVVAARSLPRIPTER
jgi:hypothetical protein